MSETIAEHTKKYPDCTEFTCPHTRNYMAKVIFKQPNRGFIATAQAFDEAGAKAVIKSGLKYNHAGLDVKSIDVEEMKPGEAAMFGLPERPLPPQGSKDGDRG
jgi:hypothetical protein